MINEIFADPTPQIDLPSVEFIELRNNTDHSLSLTSWKFSDSGNSTTFGGITIDPRSFLIICAKADTAEFKAYGKVLGLSPWPSLNNSGELIKLFNAENLLIDSIRYSDTWYRSAIKKQGGWTLESKHPGLKCQGFLNWFASLDSTGGTPGRENSIYIPGYDISPLTADSINQISDTTLKIYFNKHLNSSTILAGNFKLNPETSVLKKVIADPDLKVLEITYDQKFLADTKYLLSIANLKDCHGVSISNGLVELSFKTPKPPVIVNRADTGKLIITEIFADPSPEVHLPLAEFIEIYNPSKDTIDLDKWTINDPNTKSTIRGQKALPREYIILCPAADTVYYKSFGKTIGINPWPSLNNNSDQLVLKSFKGRVVDSVAYFDTWYRSSVKKTGGWSLEKIDLSSVCEGLFNWNASIDTNGGTPGKINSVNVSGYDLLQLKTDSVKLVSDSTIKLYFNKHLNTGTLLAENFKLIPANSVTKIISDAQLKEITLSFKDNFQKGTEYQIHVLNVKDCSGSSFANSLPLVFKTAQPKPPVKILVDTAQLIITEIFADPSPEVHLPLVEYIEIYNPSKDTIDLDKWSISDPSTKASIYNKKILPREYIILCPTADTIHYKSYGKTIGINPWPSLNNNSDQVVLKSFRNRVVDSVAYSDTWYRNSGKKQGGWSIEKIDLTTVCKGLFNWTASIDTNGGTPGKINSVNVSGYDRLELKADSVKLLTDSTIKVYFNPPLSKAQIYLNDKARKI